MKTALVTGAARGIGLATARLFLKEGWQVAIIDRDAPALQDAAAGLEGVYPHTCDISDEASVAEMVRDVTERFGRLDALVNNAGVADFGPIEDTTFARWRRVMETNLDGPFLCTQAATPALKETKGAVVNIASISGLRLTPDLRL